jgi:hypothetical protein
VYALRYAAVAPSVWEEDPQSATPPARLFLRHLGTTDIFAPAHVVSLVMGERPRPAESTWRAESRATGGNSQRAAMTLGGERGMSCQGPMAQESLRSLHQGDHPLTSSRYTALVPLLCPLLTRAGTLRRDSTQSGGVSILREAGEA